MNRIGDGLPIHPSAFTLQPSFIGLSRKSPAFGGDLKWA
jgi:hypothetical protein